MAAAQQRAIDTPLLAPLDGVPEVKRACTHTLSFSLSLSPSLLNQLPHGRREATHTHSFSLSLSPPLLNQLPHGRREAS